MKRQIFAFKDRFIYSMLFVFEHFLGRRLVDVVFGRARSNLQNRMLLSVKKNGVGKTIQVDRVHNLPVEKFFELYASQGKPVVFEGGALRWECCTKWSFDYFKENYGDDDVLLVNHEALGANDLESPYVHISLRELIEQMDEGGLKYARFHPLLDHHPELQEDFDRSWLGERIYKATTKAFNFHILFLGGNGTNTAIHNAINDNLFMQIEGQKKWVLWPASYGPAFMPGVNRGPAKSSTLQYNQPDHEQFPMFKYIDAYETILNPGDILYVPPYMWHYVENLSHSIGVGLRWMSISSAFKSSKLFLGLEAFNVHPTVFKTVYMLLRGFDFNKVLAAHKGYQEETQTKGPNKTET